MKSRWQPPKQPTKMAFLRKKPAVQVTPTWMVVGLGNPGSEYRGTRHNVGFDVIEKLAGRNHMILNRAKHQARISLGMIGDTGVLLVKPITYMNNSGRAVAPLAKEFNIKTENVLVIADDLDLQVGRVRIKPKGSAGGHNGHKSIIALLGTSEYPRVKIGIGAVDRSETIDHVLGTFDREEQGVIAQAIDRATKGVELCVTAGLDAGMNEVNQGG